MTELLLPPPVIAAGPTTDPSVLLGLAEGMFAIDVLTAAVVRFGVVEALDQESMSVTDLAHKTGMTPRAAIVTTTLLEVLDVVEADLQQWQLTSLAREFLLADSPWTIVPVYEALAGRPDCQAMSTIMAAATDGGEPEPEPDLDWASGMAGLEFARSFLRSTDSRNNYLAHAVAERFRPAGRRLLDVAGGSGVYSCALARAYPGLRVVILEQPPVDVLAREAVAGRGLDDRVEVVTGDMFSDETLFEAGGTNPTQFDNVLMSNVLHDWDLPDISRLLAAAWRVLRPGGQLVVHDAFLGRGRRRDRSVAEYSALLMKFTAGRCHSLGDLTAVLDATGFIDVEVLQTVVNRDLLVANKPGVRTHD